MQASYGVDDPEFAITQLAQTTMRSEVGKISLDTVFKEREVLNVSIVGTWLHGGLHLQANHLQKRSIRPPNRGDSFVCDMRSVSAR